MLFVLKIGLERHGFEVITASDTIDALMKVKAHSGDFCAMVTDHDMPEMNGLELARSVRNIGFKGRIAVMSGRLKVEDLRAYKGLGISGFFHKPFEVGSLAAMLLQAN